MNIITITKTISNCTECEKSFVLPDPDLQDWFCHDDVQLECALAERTVTCACRPHHLDKECKIPDWCPLLNKE